MVILLFPSCDQTQPPLPERLQPFCDSQGHLPHTGSSKSKLDLW
uniref:Uncharacterized protein n=1 Tax=Trichinella nativa TaxID=6335 RepID=A0A0V1KHI4_9BILA